MTVLSHRIPLYLCGLILICCWLIPIRVHAAASVLQLDSPTTQSVSANGQLHLVGRTTESELMLSLQFTGTVPNAVYAQQRIVVKSGRFDAWVWLPWGNGVYELALWKWDKSRNSYLQLHSFQVKNNASIRVAEVLAPPVLMWTFQPAVDRIELPLRSISEAQGKVPLRVRTKYKKLLVTITKDGVATRYVLPVIDGVIDTSIWLSRGTGRYDVTLWCPGEGSSYIPWAVFSVSNQISERLTGIDEAPLWFDAAWQGNLPRVVPSGIEAMMGGTSGIKGGKLVLTGQSTVPYLVASAEKDGEIVRYRLPVGRDGRFLANVWLRFGVGVYTVTLWAEEGGTGKLTALVRFVARAADNQAGRYLAPSLGVESDHPQIRELAQKLAKPGMDVRTAALAIHDWVAGNIAYDVAKYRNGISSPDDGALKTLQTRKGVCQDYSYLTVALMRSAGMEARIAVGRARGYSFGGRGEWGPHAWVEVRIVGRWVVLDPTWDAGAVLPDGRFQRAITRTYFDPKPEVFARDHQLLEYQY